MPKLTIALAALAILAGWVLPLAPSSLGMYETVAQCSDARFMVLILSFLLMIPLSPVFGLAGAAVGWGQRRFFGELPLRRWLIGSAVGMIVAAALSVTQFGLTNFTWRPPDSWLVAGLQLGAFVGAFMGFIQWWALAPIRKQRRDVLWIPASTAIWAAASGTLWLVYRLAGGPAGVWWGIDCGATYFGADPKPPVDWDAVWWAIGWGWAAGGLLLFALSAAAATLLPRIGVYSAFQKPSLK